MHGQHFRKALAALLSVTMVVSTLLPSTALAIESQVRVEDHQVAGAQAQEISDLVIGDVDAPKVGEALDDTATVRSVQGDSWDVPVLWIDQDLQLVTTASEDGSYLPAIVFFVPEAYRVKATDGAYLIRLSDELTELYGTNEVVSVYDAARGITYILPARLRDYFTPRTGRGADAGQASEQAVADAGSVEAPANSGSDTKRSIIDIYCSKSARDSFTDEDLEWLLDLVLNKLQPQAINLLLEKFPAFGEAAAKGQIGTKIGLYVYYLSGDKDGHPDHESTPEGALAFVNARAVPVGDSYHIGYMIGIDLSSLAEKGDDGTLITNPTTGKYTLVRDGKSMETFENTIVHELFHALMFDYNRVGMTGSLKASDYVTKPDGTFYSEEQGRNYSFTHFPIWFMEGIASSVENVYDFRQFSFLALRVKGDNLRDSFDTPTLVYNYVNGMAMDGTPFYYDLYYADGLNERGEKISNENAAYVMGYLATLYLGELQARQSGKTAINGGAEKTVSSEVLRGGLNDILKRLHAGETLDEVINSISPVVDGNKVYNDTTEFQKKFIKGSLYTNGGKVEEGKFSEEGDYVDGKGSAPFVVDVLNYFVRIGKQEGRVNKYANGSILFDFERDFASPLDKTTNDQSDYLKIVESNTLVISTVPDSMAFENGGKSRSGTPGHDSAMPTQEDEYPMVDIQTAPMGGANGESDGVQATSVEEVPAPSAPILVEGADDDETIPLAAKAAADLAHTDATDTADNSKEESVPEESDEPTVTEEVVQE